MSNFIDKMKTDKGVQVSTIAIILFILFICFCSKLGDSNNIYSFGDNTFNIISSSENKEFDSYIKSYTRKQGYNVSITYDDTLKIMNRINSGESFDGIWLSNSIWTYMIDSSKAYVGDSKSTSINPIIFGIKKSKAKELGFIDKDVYSKDILSAIEGGKLKFNMSNPTSTNSGASAYLGILSTLAGNPEVLTSEMLDKEDLKNKLKTFFSGVERSSGDEDFLEEMFIKGDYEAVFSYESSIININKKLESQGKETLYAVYPIDGVSISDSPFAYIDKKDDNKKKIYNDIQKFLLSNKSQEKMAAAGRRTWYGGINKDVDKKIFNPDWGIDTTTYISPSKYPSTAVIKKALSLYQTTLRKPVHVAFCLDYSGSMYGNGYSELVDAMDYILTERAANDLLQFSDEDVVDVLPFENDVTDVWSTSDGLSLDKILSNIKGKDPSGATALYPCAEKALELVSHTDRNKQNPSVILMTDGQANVGTYDELYRYYRDNKSDIAIYSIMFGSASEYQLSSIARMSNGKVFDGKKNLIEAFKEVRGYN